MKKLSFLLGTLGGALAGYLLNNEGLRKQLLKAKDAEHAAKTLGKHLERDGKKLAVEAKKFLESDDVQKNMKKAKKFAKQKFNQAKNEVKAYLREQQNR